MGDITEIIKELPIKVGIDAVDWAVKKLETMNLDQKIGQLMHIATWSGKPQKHRDEISNLINKYGVGGLIFFQGNPKSQAEQINYYQKITKIPLMVSTDAEWGLGMRLDQVEPFPYQITLGAINDIVEIYEMGRVVGRQLKRAGVNVNFAPVIDINTNPKNPVINFRSFGENKNEVANRGIAYMKGLQDEGILACAKHFPGHGDTDTDSHKELPFIDKSEKELQDTELYPFKRLIKEGLGSIMTAHLYIPQLDPKTRASSMSPQIIDGLLKNKLRFKGLVFTDALDMKAVTDQYEPGEIDAEAFKAGNDILVFVKNVDAAVKEIKKAISKNEISEEEIESRCMKQLVYKHWMNLHQFQQIEIANIVREINHYTAEQNSRLFQKAATILKSDASMPQRRSEQSLAILSLFANGDNPDINDLDHHTLLKGTIEQTKSPYFERQLLAYYHSKPNVFILKSGNVAEERAYLIEELKQFDSIVIAYHNIKLKAPENCEISDDLNKFFESLMLEKDCHLVFFGNPYALGKIESLGKAKSIILTYQENKYTHEAAFRALTGQVEATGKLPVSINEQFIAGY